MKKFLVLTLIILLTACSGNDPSQQLKNVNGYWEINKVEVEKDSVISYGLSQYIDYIEINDSTGFRKKLQPKFEGGYVATNNSEKVTAEIENGKLFLYYSTPYANWREEVLKAGEEELVIINRDGKIYYYRRYTPLLSQNDEKKKE